MKTIKKYLCPECQCTETSQEVVDITAGIVCESIIRCKDCGEYLDYYAYGHLESMGTEYKKRIDMKKFNFRIENLEVRCGVDNDTSAIVKWFETGKTCYVLAYFKQGGDDNNDFDLKFVGGRPFEDDVCMVDFMRLAKHGYIQLMLNLVLMEDE